MKCNSDICIYYNNLVEHNCEVFDAIELDMSARCDCFVLADDAFIYEKQAEETYKKIQERRKNKYEELLR